MASYIDIHTDKVGSSSCHYFHRLCTKLISHMIMDKDIHVWDTTDLKPRHPWTMGQPEF